MNNLPVFCGWREDLEELLPCPFCGQPPTHLIYKSESLFSHNIVDWLEIKCMGCNIMMSGEDMKEVVAAWNKRTGSD